MTRGRINKFNEGKMAASGKLAPHSFQIDGDTRWFKAWADNFGDRQVGDLILFDAVNKPWDGKDKWMATISTAVPEADANEDMPPKPVIQSATTKDVDIATAVCCKEVEATLRRRTEKPTKEEEDEVTDGVVDRYHRIKERLQNPPTDEPTFDEKYEAENNGVDISADGGEHPF